MIAFKTSPRAHQAAALTRMADAPAFALMMGVGTGKSWLVVNDILQQDADVAVILAPPGVHSLTWRDEQFPAHWSGGPIEVAAARSGRKDYGLHDLLHSTAPVRVACVNYEALSSDAGLKVVATLLRQGKRPYIAGDESHNFKRPSGKRTRAIWRLGALARWRRILSGTMTPRGYEDLYAQYRMLDWRIIGQPTAKAFRERYCQMTMGYSKGKTHSFETIAKDKHGRSLYQNIDELMRRIAPVTFQTTKAECLDLPTQTWVDRPVVLSAEQRRLYTELVELCIAETANGTIITAEQTITRILRLQQIVAGHVGTEEAWEPIACPRLEDCAHVVEQSDGKVLVWARFKPDRIQLQRTFNDAGIGSVVYEGPDREERYRRFKQDPGLRAFIANPASGGAGLTLNEAPNAVHYSLSFNWKDLEQSEGRNHRDGQAVPVTYTTMFAPGTTDAHVRRVLRNRQDVHEAVTTARELERWIRPSGNSMVDTYLQEA